MADKLDTGFFIARRISGRGGRVRSNIMVRIATATVAIGIAVMIVALAVISGFKRELTARVTGFGAQVQVVNLDGNTSFETVPIHRDPQLEERLRSVPNVAYVQPYAIKGGIARSDEAMQGVVFKGGGTDYDWTFFAEALTAGELPDVGSENRKKEVIISGSLAALLAVEAGDRLEMLFIQSDRPPRRDLYRVSGIYDTGFEELDMVTVVGDIRDVQRLNGWDADLITGYEATSTGGNHERFYGDIYQAVYEMPSPEGDVLMVLDITDRYPNLFDWLKAHNVNALVIIVIMLMVSLLNMVAAMLIILLERTGMIGTLKALGMDNGALRRIFVIRSGYILLWGLFWGNLAGLGICLLQMRTGVLKLDRSGYFLSQVPVSLEPWWWVALNAGTFALLVALMLIPTTIISRLSPDATLRLTQER
ncbi:MAG: ABC transporter permease [Alistipes sp.]|nr:ABC transporter permease [Alistipes sp.]